MDNSDLSDQLKRLLNISVSNNVIICEFCGQKFHPTRIHHGPHCTYTCELMSMETQGFITTPEMYERIREADEQATATEKFIVEQEKLEEERKAKEEALKQKIFGTRKLKTT